jgi:hypothetical protein
VEQRDQPGPALVVVSEVKPRLRKMIQGLEAKLQAKHHHHQIEDFDLDYLLQILVLPMLNQELER